MKKLPIILLFIIVASAVSSFSYKTKSAEANGIKWMTWSEVQDAEKKEHRKIFVDVYTGWCGWCKRMDAGTFTNPDIVQYMNQNFYAVKFDAETQSTINFNGKDYKYIAQGTRGYNELAAQILNGQMSYPTSVYFDEKLEEIFPVPGYQEPRMLESIMTFVASNSYKTIKYDEYQKTFVGKIK